MKIFLPNKSSPSKQTKALIDKFRKCDRWRHSPYLNALLSAIAPDLPAVQKLAQCGTPIRDGLGIKYSDRVFKGCRYRARRYSCMIPYCSRCAAKSRKAEAKRMFRKIASMEPLTTENTSWITIREDILPLGSDFSVVKMKFRRKLTRIIERYFPTCRVAAQFSISVNPDRTGLLHIHGAIIHQGVKRSDLEKRLKQRFVGKCAVVVAEPNSDNIEEEWLEPGDIRRASGFGRYSCDVRLEGKNWFEDELPQVLLDQIVSLDSIRGRKREGLRLEIGLRKKRKSKVIPQSLAIIHRLRKRFNIGGTSCRNSYEITQNVRNAVQSAI